MLKKKHILTVSTFLLTAAVFTHLSGQNANQLAQKMELENGIKDRISIAVERVLGHQQFVVDVKAEVDFMPDRKIEEVYKPASKQRRIETPQGSAATASKPSASMSGGTVPPAGRGETGRSSAADRQLREILPGIPSEMPMAGIDILEDDIISDAPAEADSAAMPLPGTEGIDELTALPGMQSPEMDIQDESEDLLFSRSVSHVQSNVPRIRHLDISIFLPEGTSPYLLESVRQVARIASQLDRDRGDVINIMTTAFKTLAEGKTDDEPVMDMKEIRYELSKEEQDQADETRRMISDIQKQLENMDRDRAISDARQPSGEPSPTENMLMKVIDKLTTRQNYEDEFEARKIIAEQNARLQMLANDTSQLRKLNDEIASLKAEIARQRNEGLSAGLDEAASEAKLAEKRALEQAISEKISMLNSTQQELAGMNTTRTPLWVWILLPLLLILVLVLLFLMLRKGHVPAAAPDRMETAKDTASQQTAIDENAYKRRILNDIHESLVKQNLIVKQSGGQQTPVKDDELLDIRNNIVNLSVSNPDAASNLMKKWVNDVGEAPAETSEEETANE